MKPTLLLLGLAAESLAVVLPQGGERPSKTLTRTFELPTFTHFPPHWPTTWRTRTHRSTRTSTRGHPNHSSTRKPWPTHHLEEREVAEIVDEIVEGDRPSKTLTRTFELPTFTGWPGHPTRTRTSTRGHPTHHSSTRGHPTRTRTSTRGHPTHHSSTRGHPTRTRTSTRGHPTHHSTKKPWPTHHVEEAEVNDIAERDIIENGDRPDPDKVQIVGITYGGTGCPQGSARSIISDDRETLTLIFDKYIAAIGPNVNIEENRRNCQVNLKLQYPGGYQYSVLGVDYRGYAKLDRGVEGVQRTNYYYSGETNDFALTSRFSGPREGDYFLHDDSDIVSRNWSPCGSNRSLNMNSQVRLTSRESHASGVLTTDSIDGNFRQIFHIRWRKC